MPVRHTVTVGIDLGGTSIRLGVYDSSMRLLAHHSMPTRVAAGPQSVVDEMASAMDTMVADARRDGTTFDMLGIGIGSPGPINLRTGVLGLLPNLPGWEGFPLRDALAEATSLPVILECDANAAAIAEWKLGAGATADVETMVMITLGTGVGSGLILDGKVWHGMFGMGGELGHSIVVPGGFACGCGSHGCLEAYASANGVTRLARALVERQEASPAFHALVTGSDFKPLDVALLAEEGDPSALSTFEEMGRYLGIGVANLISTLDPALIVIGGGVASAWSLFAPAMFASVREHSVVYRLVEPHGAGPNLHTTGHAGPSRWPARRCSVAAPCCTHGRAAQLCNVQPGDRSVKRLGLVLLSALSLTASAEIRFPRMLSDHAVLQRERPLHVWGWATPGAHLSARFHDQTLPAVANDIGKWELWFAPEKAGGPYTLVVSGDGPEKTLSDLLVGDVWVASGQSNMEMPLAGFGPDTQVKNSAQEIASATNPKLRLLLVEHKASDFPLDDITTSWTECTPETARHFSAVAYFFGREIAGKEKVPVGLIDSTWGGTPADAWVSMDTLGTDPALLPAFASRAHFSAHLADTDAMLAAEKREDAAAKAAGKSAPSHPWHPFETSYAPAGLYNAMIAPLTPISIKGWIWYQGETNSGHDRAPYYATLFPALIGDWRARFAQGNLPFLFVQISSFNSPGEDWGRIRDAQRRTLHVANTAMAVTLDIGLAGNVHPPDKQTVGARLALGARSMVYGEHVPYTSPLFREATREVQPSGTFAMRVWFDHGEGLTYQGKPATGFELAGADGKFVPAEARVEGETVLVQAAAVPQPMFVRYGWMSVMESNLFNAEGLPASTFTSEVEGSR